MALDGDIPPGSSIDFDYIVPDHGEIRGRQITHALALGLPEATPRKALTLFANGPSAKRAAWRDDETTLALNGALRLFTAQGRAPTYYACCDPQELVAEFLTEAPASTIYYVAAKCHPKVFERLDGRDVRLWHVNDYHVPGVLKTPLCSSITLSALWLFQRLGFTDFDIWGWDGCYLDGEHHANQPAPAYRDAPNFVQLNYGGVIRDGEVIGGRTFETTRTWAAEARGAEQFFQLAHYLDLNINLHGDGMMKAARQGILGD